MNGTGTNSLSAEWIDAYSCLECRKTIKRMNLSFAGRTFRPLPVCECARRKFDEEQKELQLNLVRSKIKAIYGEGLIDDELKKASFESFEVRPGTETAYRIAKRFADNFANQTFGLYLFGPVGTGKSHLAAAIHHEMIKRGKSSVFIDVTQLFGLARSTFARTNQKTDQDYIKAAINAELLTLDEIGLKPLTEYEFGLLFQILNGRKGKVTNFTSNLDLAELDQWFRFDKNGKELDKHGRLMDRVIGSTQPIRVVAESYRKYKAMQRMKAI